MRSLRDDPRYRKKLIRLDRARNRMIKAFHRAGIDIVNAAGKTLMSQQGYTVKKRGNVVDYYLTFKGLRLLWRRLHPKTPTAT